MAFRDTLPRKGRPSTLVGVDRLGFRVLGRVHGCFLFRDDGGSVGNGVTLIPVSSKGQALTAVSSTGQALPPARGKGFYETAYAKARRWENSFSSLVMISSSAASPFSVASRARPNAGATSEGSVTRSAQPPMLRAMPA